MDAHKYAPVSGQICYFVNKIFTFDHEHKQLACVQKILNVFKIDWVCSKIFECVQKYLNVFKIFECVQNIWMCSKILEFIQNELHVFYELCAETLAETIE